MNGKQDFSAHTLMLNLSMASPFIRSSFSVLLISALLIQPAEAAFSFKRCLLTLRDALVDLTPSSPFKIKRKVSGKKIKDASLDKSEAHKSLIDHTLKPTREIQMADFAPPYSHGAKVSWDDLNVKAVIDFPRENFSEADVERILPYCGFGRYEIYVDRSDPKHIRIEALMSDGYLNDSGILRDIANNTLYRIDEALVRVRPASEIRGDANRGPADELKDRRE